MNAAAPFLFLTLIFFALTLITLFDPTGSMGCYVVGTEINGNYSTEYLMMGNC